MQQTPRQNIFWRSAKIGMFLDGSRFKIYEKSKHYSLWYETWKCHFYRWQILVNQNYRFWSQLYELCYWIHLCTESILSSAWNSFRLTLWPSCWHVVLGLYCIRAYNWFTFVSGTWREWVAWIYYRYYWPHTKVNAWKLQKIQTILQKNEQLPFKL